MAERIRLDKMIADTGTASRRESAELIRRGCVTVDGVAVCRCEEKIDPLTSEIAVNGKQLTYAKYHYFMMNKPSGVISATEDRAEKTVLDLLTPEHLRMGLCPAGRLDKDAVGLLLLTDDGAFAHRVISPKQHVNKTYLVLVDGLLSERDIKAFADGIVLRDGLKCLPGTLEIVEAGAQSSALVTIHEGKYHQVKRMLASLGKPVLSLKRTRIGALQLDETLLPGAYRELSESERNQLFG